MEEILQDAQGLCRAGTKCTERKVSIVAKEQNTKVIDAILSSSGSDASASKSRARRSRRVKGFQKSGASNGSLPELVMSAADVAALEEKTEKTPPHDHVRARIRKHGFRRIEAGTPPHPSSRRPDFRQFGRSGKRRDPALHPERDADAGGSL